MTFDLGKRFRINTIVAVQGLWRAEQSWANNVVPPVGKPASYSYKVYTHTNPSWSTGTECTNKGPFNPDEIEHWCNKAVQYVSIVASLPMMQLDDGTWA